MVGIAHPTRGMIAREREEGMVERPLFNPQFKIGNLKFEIGKSGWWVADGRGLWV
jgi:hypothetical protein